MAALGEFEGRVNWELDGRVSCCELPSGRQLCGRIEAKGGSVGVVLICTYLLVLTICVFSM